MTGVRWWLDLLFPPRCAACDASLFGCAQACLCAKCHDGMPWHRDWTCLHCGTAEPLGRPISFHGLVREDEPEADATGRERRVCASCLGRDWRFTRAAGVAEYAGPARALVLGLKFRGLAQFADGMGLLMARRVRDAGFPDCDAVVPVPLCRSRMRVRGYNQAELLARALVREYDCPLVLDWLRRQRMTPAQTGRNAAARRRFPGDAFTTRGRLRGRRVLLVDDVLTTGATASAAAAALRAAGAEEVYVVVFAR